MVNIRTYTLLCFTLLFSCTGSEVVYEYYDNGTIMEIKTMRGDILDGKFEYYFENGTLAATGQYRRNQMHGEWEKWHADGSKMSFAVFDNGKLVNSNAWNPDGTQTIFNCTGSGVMYYDDGSPMSKVTYVNCIKDGEWLTWHENGKLASQIFYRMGERTGTWQFWEKDGSLRKVEEYD